MDAKKVMRPKVDKPMVRLAGEDGNAYMVMGRVMRALRRMGFTAEQVQEYKTEATKGNYDNLLAVTMEWVDEPSEDENLDAREGRR